MRASQIHNHLDKTEIFKFSSFIFCTTLTICIYHFLYFILSSLSASNKWDNLIFCNYAALYLILSFSCICFFEVRESTEKWLELNYKIIMHKILYLNIFLPFTLFLNNELNFLIIVLIIAVNYVIFLTMLS